MRILKKYGLVFLVLLILFPLNVGAVTFVASSTDQGTGTTASCEIPGIPQFGDVLIKLVHANGNQPQLETNMQAEALWGNQFMFTDFQTYNSNSASFAVGYLVLDSTFEGGGAVVDTGLNTSDRWSTVCLLYRGVDTSSPLKLLTYQATSSDPIHDGLTVTGYGGVAGAFAMTDTGTGNWVPPLGAFTTVATVDGGSPLMYSDFSFGGITNLGPFTWDISLSSGPSFAGMFILTSGSTVVSTTTVIVDADTASSTEATERTNTQINLWYALFTFCIFFVLGFWFVGVLFKSHGHRKL